MNEPCKLYGTGPLAVVDDDPIDRMTIERAFGSSTLAGRYELRTFPGGEDFVAYLDRAEGGAEPMPSAVLLDINMPRMNGFEVLEAMRSRDAFARIPCVMMLTNSDAERDRARATALGADSFQSKATRLESVVEMLDAMA